MIFIRKIKKYFKSEYGASAVEFALIAPILILMLIGTVDFGMFIMERMQLQNTAHTVANFVAQTQDDRNIQTIAAESYGANFADITLVSNFTCECSDSTAQTCPVDCGDDDYQRRFINVTASGNFSALFPYPFLPDSMELQSSVRMRVD
ncbi:MAG: pilus assembly protein [Alphaproteobacteria bacterium]|nr:pilus assembly protein [Alphaproteobacteria bacterium]